MAGIDFNQLRAFLAVAEELSFSRAADSLHMTQPPVSRLVQNLEKELRVELFIRTTRKVSLTPAGVAFRDYARTATRAMETVKVEIDLLSQGRIGHVTIGFYSAGSHGIISRLAQVARERIPEISLDFENSSTVNATVSKVLDGTFDAAIVRTDANVPTLHSLPMLKEEPVVLFEANHPFCQRETLSFTDLKDERFVTLHPSLGSTTRQLLFEWCFAAGYTPVIAQNAPNSSVIGALVAAGSGVNLTYDSVARNLNNPSLAWRPLDVGEFSSYLQFIWRPDPHNKTITAIIEVAREVSSEEIPDA